jgi:ribosome biogenesis GTPase
VFLVNGLDGDYNIRRIERYLSLTAGGDLRPVIVLNKTDRCANVPEKLLEVGSIAPGVSIVSLSAINNEGIDTVRAFIAPGTTAAFLGSSGVGKSTIINRLLGQDKQKVGTVRVKDSRGRHVTTHRELIPLPGGGMVIDNPGLRELQVWAEEKQTISSFPDILELAEKCRYRDCQHTNEPLCAVRTASETGGLDPLRLESYRKLRKERKQYYIPDRKEKEQARRTGRKRP